MEKEIPFIIHQMWLDKNMENNEIPPDKYLKLGYPMSWMQKNPNFEYKLWNREKIKNLLKNHPVLNKYENFYYNSLYHHIERCDFGRFLIMYAEGGIYVDLDFRCVKNIEPLIKGKQLQVWFEPIEHTEQWDRHIGKII